MGHSQSEIGAQFLGSSRFNYGKEKTETSSILRTFIVITKISLAFESNPLFAFFREFALTKKMISFIQCRRIDL